MKVLKTLKMLKTDSNRLLWGKFFLQLLVKLHQSIICKI